MSFSKDIRYFLGGGNLKEKYSKLLFHEFLPATKGVIAIEVAILMPTFFLMLFFIVNTCYIIYFVAAVDLAVVEAGKISSVSDGNYKSVFINKLKDQSSLWFSTIDTNNEDDFSINVRYCSSVDDATNNRCQSEVAGPIAIYEIEYSGLTSLISSALNLNVSVSDVYIIGAENND